VGLSVDVEVETADRSGSFVAHSAPPAGGEVASLDGGPGLNERIREIIAENAGRKP
jgi:membrane fusion protein (multidrug efflux system)